jgi:prolyl-tRNA editing enzyme YbaK/EbsC (Cys-tRNA(Pro) deacylase)
VETVYGGTGVPNNTLRIHSKDLIKLTQAQVFDFSKPKED